MAVMVAAMQCANLALIVLSFVLYVIEVGACLPIFCIQAPLSSASSDPVPLL